MSLLVLIAFIIGVILFLVYIILEFINEWENVKKTAKMLIQGLAIGVPLIFAWLYLLSIYLEKK